MKKNILIYFTLILITSSINVFGQVNLQQGLVAYWNFDSTLNDQSGNSFNGISLLSSNYSVSRVPNFNQAIEFDSSQNIVDFGDILDSVFAQANASFAISCWANTFQKPSYKGGNMIVTKSFGGNGPYQWLINHDTDGFVYGTVSFTSSASSYVEFRSTTAIPLNNWFHVILQFDGNAPDSNKVVLKINGINGLINRQVGTYTNTTWDTDMSICVGGSISPVNSTTGNHYTGLVDEVKIYNRVLSQDEMLVLAEIIPNNVNELTNTYSNSKVYPNPTTHSINIQSDKAISDIKLYSIDGKLILNQKNKSYLDLSELEPGTYYVVYSTIDDLIHYTKVVKH